MSDLIVLIMALFVYASPLLGVLAFIVSENSKLEQALREAGVTRPRPRRVKPAPLPVARVVRRAR